MHYRQHFQLGLAQPVNEEKVAFWYHASAEQGYGVASNNLAGMYAVEQGVKQDLEKANYWRKQAIAQGFHHTPKL